MNKHFYGVSDGLAKAMRRAAAEDDGFKQAEVYSNTVVPRLLRAGVPIDMASHLTAIFYAKELKGRELRKAIRIIERAYKDGVGGAGMMRDTAVPV